MNIVLDANIVIAALMGSRGTLTIITSQHYNFYVPRWIISEIRKNKDYICSYTGYSSEEFYIYLDALFPFMHIMEYIEYETYIKKAKSLIAKRDWKDVDYLAVAFAVNADFIWSNDKDFTVQKIVPTKTTDQFIEERKKQ